MSIDSVGPKPPPSAPKPIAPAKIEEAKPIAQAKVEPSIKEKLGEGFDAFKKKLMSTTGKYVAHQVAAPDRPDLKALVASQRSVVQSGASLPVANSLTSSTGSTEGAGKPDATKLKAAIADGSDTKIRELVNKDPSVLKGLSAEEKGKAMNTLESGYCAKEDQQAMAKIVKSCESKEELRQVISTASGKKDPGQAEFHKYDQQMTAAHPCLVANLLNPDNKALPEKLSDLDVKPAVTPSTDPKQSASGTPYLQPTAPGQPLPSVVDDKTPLGDKSGPQILKDYSQANGFPGRNMERCGPTSVIGQALMKGGTKEVAQLARREADALPKKPEYDKDRKALLDVAKKIESGKGTYGDLGNLGQMIHERNQVQTPGGPAMPHGSATELFIRGGETPPEHRAKKSAEHLSKPENFNEAFPPGKQAAWPAKVAINGSNEGNHWVTIGRDEKGRAFVYDPLPKDPSARPQEAQIIYQDVEPEAFAKYQAAIGSGKPGTGIAHTERPIPD